MDQQAFRAIMSGNRRGAGPVAIRAAAWLAALPYALAMRARRWLYARRVFRSRAAAGHTGRSAPVISIGNITTGGTGKTPMTAWLARHLLEMGRRPAILLRGYKAVAGRSDEAQLLHRLCNQDALDPSTPASGSPAVQVIVNPDRVAAAADAVDAGADVILLDDGFQHRRLRRQLDIVLIDATQPFGFGHCLPRGLLREPLSALGAADVLVITRSDLVAPEALVELRQQLSALAPRTRVAIARHEAAGLEVQPVAGDSHGQRAHVLPLSSLRDRRVLAFCALGNPDGFFGSLERAGAQLAGRLVFDDHAGYDEQALAAVRAAADGCAADVLVTTAKDAVKLPPGIDMARPLWTLRMAMKIAEGEAELMAAVRGAIGAPV